MSRNISVFGIFQDRDQLEDASAALRRSGFRATDISVLLPYNSGSKDIAIHKATKSPEGAACGIGFGAVIGTALGWLASIGIIAIPGADPLMVATPLVSALAGAGAGAAIGGAIGAITGLGFPEYEARRYKGRLRKGGILLSVHCDDSQWVKLAHDILGRMGGEHISSSSESAADFAAADRPFPRAVLIP